MDGNNPIVVATKQLTNIQVQGSMTHTASVDTSNLPSNAWSTAFGARLSGLIGDSKQRQTILLLKISVTIGHQSLNKQQSAVTM